MSAEHPSLERIEQIARSCIKTNNRSVVSKSMASLASDLLEDLQENNIFDFDRNACLRKLVALSKASDNIDNSGNNNNNNNNQRHVLDVLGNNYDDEILVIGDEGYNYVLY